MYCKTSFSGWYCVKSVFSCQTCCQPQVLCSTLQCQVPATVYTVHCTLYTVHCRKAMFQGPWEPVHSTWLCWLLGECRKLIWLIQNLYCLVEKSSPKRLFSWNNVFSVFVDFQIKYFNETMVSVYLLVHQKEYLTWFSVNFFVC